MENFLLPVAIEEATIPIITERVSGEMKKKGLHGVTFEDFGHSRIAMFKKPASVFLL
jgi:hypothetical protein